MHKNDAEDYAGFTESKDREGKCELTVKTLQDVGFVSLKIKGKYISKHLAQSCDAKQWLGFGRYCKVYRMHWLLALNL